MSLSAEISYNSIGVNCFAPEKVVGCAQAHFRQCTVDWTDHAEKEFENLRAKFVNMGLTPENMETLMRQAKGKMKRVGPVLHFQVKCDGYNEWIDCIATRFCIEFPRAADLPVQVRSQLRKFLDELAITLPEIVDTP
jgi:hypothetical protein